MAPSKIGLGVFAARRLRRGLTLGEVRGTIFHGAENATPYCIELDDERSLEPTEPFRFLNHSCSPNCEIFSWEDEPDRIFLHVLETIQPDEELTIDYAWAAEAAIPCLCGAQDCRGWIVDVGQLQTLLAREKRRRRRRAVSAT